jgi:hypothetical protein
MPFDFSKIASVAFGICLDTTEGESYRLVPCDQGVQDALTEMLVSTIVSLKEEKAAIQEFSPAEKYGATERLRISLDSDLVAKHRAVFASENLTTDTHGLDVPSKLVSYFATFQDVAGHKLMGFRRAAHFKGVVKKHLVTFMNDALRIVPDSLFKLDTDFDFLIFDNQILIWRPSGFIFTAGMEEHIMASAAANVQAISKEMTCVSFDGLSAFVAKHKLGMRLVAALKSRADLAAISLRLLKASCKSNEVHFTVKGGKLVPSEGSEMDFLMLLDRRLYTLMLIEKHPETYQAASRSPTARSAAPAP